MTALSHTVALEAVPKHKSIDCGVALPAQNDLPLRTLCVTETCTYLLLGKEKPPSVRVHPILCDYLCIPMFIC